MWKKIGKKQTWWVKHNETQKINEKEYFMVRTMREMEHLVMLKIKLLNNKNEKKGNHKCKMKS
jgi:hypothetical protein